MNYTKDGAENLMFGNQDPASRRLWSEHRAMLNAAGITDPVIDNRGYFSVSTGLELQMLGLQGVKGPALVIPEHALADGEMRFTIRPDDPADRRRKYVAERGKFSRFTASPMGRELVLAANEIYATEGAKKADSLLSIGIPAFSMQGVWNFGASPSVGLPVLSDIQSMKPNGKTFVIAFDSDARRNSQVMRALQAFTTVLEGMGARVKWAIPPDAPDGGKQGIDDYLASITMEASRG